MTTEDVYSNRNVDDFEFENNIKAYLMNEDMINNVVSSEEKELKVFLYSIFQFYVEKAVKMSNKKEMRVKHRALDIFNSLIKHSFLNYIKNNFSI